jgi:hypothetical protein
MKIIIFNKFSDYNCYRKTFNNFNIVLVKIIKINTTIYNYKVIKGNFILKKEFNYNLSEDFYIKDSDVAELVLQYNDIEVI